MFPSLWGSRSTAVGVERSDSPETLPTRRLGHVAPVVLALVFLACVFVPEIARAQNSGAEDLIAVSDTPVQRQLSTYTGAICEPLQGSPSGTPQADLAEVCLDLTQTATALESLTVPPLDLDEDGLRDALDDIAHRQLPATAKSSSEISAVHTATVSSRLFALRQEETPDILMAGSLIDSEGNRLPLHYAWDRDASAAGLRDRMPEGLGLYLNGNGAFGHRDSDDEELGFDFRNLGFTLGSDYRLSDASVVGGAFTYVNTFQDFNRDKGEIDVHIVAFSAYGTHRVGQLYFNGVATYAHGEIDIEREIVYADVDRQAKGDTSSDEFAFALGSGYEFQWKGFTYGPMMEWEWLWLDIRSFTETGADGLNLQHSHDQMKSATVDLGVEGSHPISTRFGVFIPQLVVAWVHQFEDDSRNIVARYEFDDTGVADEGFFLRTKSPDRNYAKISAAVSGSFKRGMSGYLSYQTIAGHKRLSSHAFSLGGRIQF